MTTEAVAEAVHTELGDQQQEATESTATAAPPGEGEGTAVETKVEAEAVKDEEIVYDFKVPDGMGLDDSVGEFKTVAKELKLPAEAAQRLVDLAVKREQNRIDAHAKQVKDWGAELAADKEIGGAKEAETRTLAAKALSLAPPGVREVLEASGLGNYPPMVRWARAIGKALSEDKHVPATRAAASSESMAERQIGRAHV